jgi:lipoprotein-anchoring transpeptidase ErfK/SrfK
MVDYVPFLARAVAALNPNSSEQRSALYDHTRKILAERIRANEIEGLVTDIRAERAALEAAIRRVELDAVSQTTSRQPNQAPETYGAPVQEYPSGLPLTDVRKRLRVIGGVLGTLAMVIAAVAAFSFWPHILPSARGILSSRSVERPAERPAANKSYINRRQVVYFRTNYPVGTIIVDKSQAFLYVVEPKVSALRYSIDVGPECTTLAGLFHVVRKDEWSGLRPPPPRSVCATYDRMQDASGDQALYLDKGYCIHGTISSPAIGQRLESCIQLVNDDVMYLRDRTPPGSRVVVLAE